MRRALLGGLGIALGVMGRPAFAQYDAGRPAAPVSLSSGRAASLGRPVAVPEADANAVTPVGLVARGQAPVAPGPIPPNTPVAAPQPVPLGAPRIVGQQPSVTEVRTPVGVPTANGPVILPEGGMIPSVNPGPTVGPIVSPDDPLCTSPVAGSGAITRVSGVGKWTVSAEYLMWWTRSTQVPVLAATGLPTGTTVNGGFAAVPPNVPILAGSFGQTRHSGFGAGATYWFGNGEQQVRGIDTRFLFLFPNTTTFSANTNEFPVLGRPFFNVNNPVGPSADIIGFPGVSIGGLTVELENSLWGAEVNYRRNLLGLCNPCYRLDGLVGFRYLNFTEQLTITEVGIVPDGSPLQAGGRAPIAIATDEFRTENNFYGGQIGLIGEVRRGRWFVNGRASIAFGTVFQSAEINGGQLQGGPGGAVPFAGGMLALPGANIGSYKQNQFAVLPEAGLNLGYQFTPRLRVFVGYDFLYLSSVLRPANTIDMNIDASRIPNFFTNPPPVLPGTPQPQPRLSTTDFFAQGINFGASWTW